MKACNSAVESVVRFRNSTQQINCATSSALLFIGLTLDSTTGDVIIADPVNQLVRQMSFTGNVTTIAGNYSEEVALAGAGSFLDAFAASARFSGPTSVAFDPAENRIFAADSANNRVRVIAPLSSSVGPLFECNVSTFAGSKVSLWADGQGTQSRFNYPTGIVKHPTNQNIYIADCTNNRLRVMNASSGFVSTLAGSGEPGNTDGVGTVAKFVCPISMSVDSLGNLLVADHYSRREFEKSLLAA